MAYASVLLKLSGEALGAEGQGLDRRAIDVIAGQIAEVAGTGVRLAVVNRTPDFSSAADDTLSAALVRLFPDSTRIGEFTVRWRS